MNECFVSYNYDNLTYGNTYRGTQHHLIEMIVFKLMIRIIERMGHRECYKLMMSQYA